MELIIRMIGVTSVVCLPFLQCDLIIYYNDYWVMGIQRNQLPGRKVWLVARQSVPAVSK